VLRVGLTGGVASGKSTVAGLLVARGAAACDADAVVARLYAPGGAGAEVVAELFGRGVLAAGGAVDRAALADVVLPDPAARQRLEEAVHPLVRAEIGRWLATLEEQVPESTVAVVEAALLVETGSHRFYHRLVVVSAPLAARRERARQAGWSDERLDRTFAAQSSDADRERVADYVIRNDADLVALEAAVDGLWRGLREDAEALGGGRPLPGR
jgi:dephospho-CoA kinase